MAIRGVKPIAASRDPDRAVVTTCKGGLDGIRLAGEGSRLGSGGSGVSVRRIQAPCWRNLWGWVRNVECGSDQISPGGSAAERWGEQFRAVAFLLCGGWRRRDLGR